MLVYKARAGGMSAATRSLAAEQGSGAGDGPAWWEKQGRRERPGSEERQGLETTEAAQS